MYPIWKIVLICIFVAGIATGIYFWATYRAPPNPNLRSPNELFGPSYPPIENGNYGYVVAGPLKSTGRYQLFFTSYSGGGRGATVWNFPFKVVYNPTLGATPTDAIAATTFATFADAQSYGKTLYNVTTPNKAYADASTLLVSDVYDNTNNATSRVYSIQDGF
jgi:hypothetical protein